MEDRATEAKDKEAIRRKVVIKVIKIGIKILDIKGGPKTMVRTRDKTMRAISSWVISNSCSKTLTLTRGMYKYRNHLRKRNKL